MKLIVVVLLVLSLSAFSEVRTGGGSGHNPSALTRGTYTFVDMYAVGLTQSYGLAIQDNVADRIWISNYGTKMNNQFDMTSGSATGTTFSITNSIDADDQAYCVYSGGNQFFFGDWISSAIGVFDETGNYIKTIPGPGGSWAKATGTAAGHDMLYCSDFDTTVAEIAWGGPYTGTETSVTWTTASFKSVSGMSVYGDYLIVCCQIKDADNIFIFEINSDGSVNMTPVWSTNFVLENMNSAGGVDYDGTYLWLYPQNTSLYKLTIDFNFSSSFETSTWGQIKNSF